MKTHTRLSRSQLDREQRNRFGCKRLAYSRSTGTLVGIYDAEAQGLDDECPWVVVCEDHGSLLGAPTLGYARFMAPVPREWCCDCQEISGTSR